MSCFVRRRREAFSLELRLLGREIINRRSCTVKILLRGANSIIWSLRTSRNTREAPFKRSLQISSSTIPSPHLAPKVQTCHPLLFMLHPPHSVQGTTFVLFAPLAWREGNKRPSLRNPHEMRAPTVDIPPPEEVLGKA